MSDCIFCRIARKELPADIVKESERAVAFRDMHPKAPVHILVIPREHYDSLRSVGENETAVLGELFSFVRDVAEAQVLSGYKVVVNVGREGGQIIDHLHVHILGGWGEKPKELNV